MANNNTNTLYIVTADGTDPIAVYGKENLLSALQDLYGSSESDYQSTRNDGVVHLEVDGIEFIAAPQQYVYGEVA